VTVVQVLGVLGFLIACGSLGWQIWAYFDAKKPKVGAAPSFWECTGRRYGTISVDVWNSGRVPVYVEEVAVGSKREGSARSGGALDDYEVERRLCLESDRPPEEPLNPGQPRTYSLPDDVAESCRTLLDFSRQGVYLSINAPGKRLLLLPGSQIGPILDDIVRSVERVRERR